MRTAKFAIPAVVLVVLLIVLGIGLTRDPREVPSPLVGKPAPAFELPLLENAQPVTQEFLKGRPRLVNFFASWCAGCQVEHPLLLKLAREQGVEIVGIAYKDVPADTRQWLQRHGSPYRSVIVDERGGMGLDWGVYGVPETFVLDAAGTIVHKQIGPMTLEAWARIAPLLARER